MTNNNNNNKQDHDIKAIPSSNRREKISLVLLGLSLGVLFFLPSDIESVETYTPPPLEKLKVTTGEVNFNPSNRKGSGGALILHVGDSKIKLACAPPNSRTDSPCFLKHKENETLDFKSEVVGKQGKAWWEPVNGSFNGRLYQLEVDGKIFINYEEQAKEYSDYFKKTQ